MTSKLFRLFALFACIFAFIFVVACSSANDEESAEIDGASPEGIDEISENRPETTEGEPEPDEEPEAVVPGFVSEIKAVRNTRLNNYFYITIRGTLGKIFPDEFFPETWMFSETDGVKNIVVLMDGYCIGKTGSLYDLTFETGFYNWLARLSQLYWEETNEDNKLELDSGSLENLPTVPGTLLCRINNGTVTGYVFNVETYEEYQKLDEADGDYYYCVYSPENSVLQLIRTEPYKRFDFSRLDGKIEWITTQKWLGDDVRDSNIYVFTDSNTVYTVLGDEITATETGILDIVHIDGHKAVVYADGTVTDSFNSDVSSWRDVVNVIAKDYGMELIGLKSDGTLVLSESASAYTECLGWNDIKDIFFMTYYGVEYVVGLKTDGMLITTSDNPFPAKDVFLSWTDVDEFVCRGNFDEDCAVIAISKESLTGEPLVARITNNE